MRTGATAPASDVVAVRLAHLRERIASAGGGDDIRVVAVTKGFGAEVVEAAATAGLRDVGESYAAELVAKRRAVDVTSDGAAASAVRWHFLGHIQRNKVARMTHAVDLWQGVDRRAAAEEIARRAPGAEVLVQVNVSGLPGRNGCTFEEVGSLVEQCSELGLSVRGLMAVGPPGPASEAVPGYRRLATMVRTLGLAECSIGMTGDLEVAVEAGSTMVRVGRGLFGPRPGPDELRR